MRDLPSSFICLQPLVSLVSMKLRILDWNVRWPNEGDKGLRKRNLLTKWKAYFICLQKTKLKHGTGNTICSLWDRYIGIVWILRGLQRDFDDAGKKCGGKRLCGEFMVPFWFRNVDDSLTSMFVGVITLTCFVIKG